MGQKLKSTEKPKSLIIPSLDFSKAISMQCLQQTFKMSFNNDIHEYAIRIDSQVQKALINFIKEESFDNLIQISYCKVNYIFALKAPKLKDMMIRSAYVVDLKQLATGVYPELNHIHISFCNKLSQAPKLNALNLESVRYYENSSLSSIQQFSRGTYPQLKSIYFSKNNFSSIYALDAPKIREIYFPQNNIKDLSQFAKMTYPFLQLLDLSKNLIDELPQIQAPNMININFRFNSIARTKKFSKTKYQKLKILNLSQNSIQLFLVNAPNLKRAQFDRNILSQISLEQNQELHQLQFFNARQCSLKRLPKCLCFSLNSTLLKICLERNQIDNIEMLGWMDLSKVKQLNLSQNRITSFHVLKRLKMPLIQDLYFQRNLAYQKDPIQRTLIMIGYELSPFVKKTLSFETKDLYYISAGIYPRYQNMQKIYKEFQVDISWVFKLKYDDNMNIKTKILNNWMLKKKTLKAFYGKHLKF